LRKVASFIQAFPQGRFEAPAVRYEHFAERSRMQDVAVRRQAVALPVILSLALAAAAAVLLSLAGRDLICPCGAVKLWHGTVPSTESSQHVLDWWSFSHLIHGFWFYAMLRYALPHLGVGWRLLGATLIEVAWEIVENSAWVIERYRAVTIAVDYNGDSVLNAMSDVGMMWLGFLLAWRLPVGASLAIVVAAEALPMLVIRDGLLLNILMLLWPLEAVADWQAGAR
jgi:Protein of unknown function (DUF2585)